MEEKIIKNPKMKIVLGDESQVKKQDKLNALRVALTYFEIQQRETTPEKVIEAAEEFLAWTIK